MRMTIRWRCLAAMLLASLLVSPQLLADDDAAIDVTAAPHAKTEQPDIDSPDSNDMQAEPLAEYKASYLVYRAGKKHGEATRYLKRTSDGYQMGYSSDISWLIFSDKRSETTDFTISAGQIKPHRYIMSRSGTGSDRYYELNLDHQNKTLSTGKNRSPKATEWQDNWLDPLSYHQQLVIDLRAGKKEFHYEVLNRHGDSKAYHYKVVAEELLALPYGNINTLRIARVEKDSDKQIYAWVAPELDYMLVRLWRGEDNVEQFDVQLAELETSAAAKQDTTQP